MDKTGKKVIFSTCVLGAFVFGALLQLAVDGVRFSKIYEKQRERISTAETECGAAVEELNFTRLYLTEEQRAKIEHSKKYGTYYYE